MTDNTMAYERKYFRLEYPQRFRPVFRIESHNVEAELTELSEGGLKFTATAKWHPGDEFYGSVQFFDGDQNTISGTVKRVSQSEVIASEIVGITFERIMMEQQWLAKQAPVYDPPA